MRRLTAIALLALAACGHAQAAEPQPLIPLLETIAASHQHGTRDNALTVDERRALLEAGDLNSYCAEVAWPAQDILEDAGYRVHHIAFIGIEPDSGGVHRGHHVVEVLDGDGWVTADLDYGRLYRQPVAAFVDGARTVAEPLEPRSDNPGPYYGVSVQAWAICVPGGCYFNPDLYSAAERSVLESQGWIATPDFNARFY